MTELVDPGWRRALPAMVPLLGRGAGQGQPQIVVMRALWVSFASTLVWIGLLVTFVMAGADPAGSSGVAFGAVLVAAAVGFVGSAWAQRRRARTDPASNSTRAYRTCFFVRLGFSELPAFVGFVCCFVVSRPTPYYFGGALALLGFAFVAPSRRFLSRQGPVLRAAMLTPPPR